MDLDDFSVEKLQDTQKCQIKKEFMTEICMEQLKMYSSDFKKLGYELCIVFTNLEMPLGESQNNSAIMKHSSTHEELNLALQGKIENPRVRPMSAYSGGSRRKQLGGVGLGVGKLGFFFLRKNQVTPDPDAIVPFDVSPQFSEADRLLNTLKPILIASNPSYNLTQGLTENTFFDIYRKLKAEEHRFKATSFGLKKNVSSIELITVNINGKKHHIVAKKIANNKVTFEFDPTLELQPVQYKDATAFVTHIAIRDCYSGKSAIINSVISSLQALSQSPPVVNTRASIEPYVTKNIRASDLKQTLLSLFSPQHHELSKNS